MARSENDIAIVRFAQMKPERRSQHTETEMLLPVVNDVIAQCGITKSDVDFTVSGSCDYLSGQAFSFVQNVDAYGAWPPIRESHVEMDGAWALYEAYVELLQGHLDIALAAGVGKNSNSDPSTLYTIEFDPYYLTPLGADPWSLAALQARALLDSGKASERDFAEVVAANRARGKSNPNAQVTGDYSAMICCQRNMFVIRCASTIFRRYLMVVQRSSWLAVSALMTFAKIPPGSPVSITASKHICPPCVVTSRFRNQPNWPLKVPVLIRIRLMLQKFMHRSHSKN